MSRSQGSIDRRTVLRGLAAATAASALPARTSEAAPSSAEGLSITVAGYRYDRVEDLIDGTVPIEGANVEFEQDAIGNLNTHAFVGPQTREVTEIGLHPFMLAYANDGFRDYQLLPVFLLRQFRHKSIFVRTDRGIERPADLRGRRIATPGYSSTSLTWIRGMLEEEYGVSPTDVEWVVSARDSAVETTGTVSAQEQVFPEGLNVATGPEGMDESDLLEAGDVDALFHAVEPRGYVQGRPGIGRLFADYRQVERDYYSRTGIFPIMHAVAIRRDVAAEHPQLARAVFNAYAMSKARRYRIMNRLGWALNMLPWFGHELEQTRALMGDNFYSYGIEPNRDTLDTLFRYSYEQGLSRKRLSVEDLFLPASLEWNEAIE